MISNASPYGNSVHPQWWWWSPQERTFWLPSLRPLRSLTKHQPQRPWKTHRLALNPLRTSNSSSSIGSLARPHVWSPKLAHSQMLINVWQRIHYIVGECLINFFIFYFLFILRTDLFAKSVIRGSESVALAVDGWVCTATDGVHLPMGVVIVDHMEVTMPTSANFWKMKKKKKGIY